MKPQEPQKREFYDLLHRAIRKGEKVSPNKLKYKKSGDYMSN